MGRYKSYLAMSKMRGGGEGHFWKMSKRKTLFFLGVFPYCICFLQIFEKFLGLKGKSWEAKTSLVNRPGVAGAVLHTALLLINALIQWSFSSRYSQDHDSQTVRARGLKFWESVHPTPCVMCHVSRVTCHVSSVTCHLSHAFFFFFYPTKILQSVGASRWRVRYQRGLPLF